MDSNTIQAEIGRVEFQWSLEDAECARLLLEMKTAKAAIADFDALYSKFCDAVERRRGHGMKKIELMDQLVATTRAEAVEKEVRHGA